MAVPFLHNIDLNQNELLNAKIHTDSSAPSNPGTGSVWFDTNTNLLKIYRGGNWDNLFVKTEAIADAGTNLATADHIYDHVTTRIADSFSDVSYSASTGVITFTQQDGTTDKTVNLPFGTSESPTFAGLTISDSTPSLTLIDTNTNADSRIHADSSNGSLFIDADFNNESTPTKIHIKTDGKEVGYFRGDSSQIGSLRLFPEKNDNAAQGIFFGTAASGSSPGVGAFTDVRAISFSSGSKLHLYPGSNTTSASVPLAISSDGSIEGTSIKDEDDLGGASSSATHLATQQSIKAYVDDKTGQANLNTELGNITENVTIGDANDVQVTIAGNLVVSGTTTTVDSNTVNIGDNIIVLNADETGTPSQDAGIEVERGDQNNARLYYDESTGRWSQRHGTGTEFKLHTEADTISIGDGGTGQTTAAAAFNALKQAATTSATGVVELATATEAKNGSGSSKVVDASQLGARSVVVQIDKDATNFSTNKYAEITHSLNTEDVIVQLFDAVTKETVYADVARTDKTGTASTTKVKVSFAQVPTNDIDVIITSAKGATAGTIAYS